jgi:hypothetical protein
VHFYDESGVRIKKASRGYNSKCGEDPPVEYTGIVWSIARQMGCDMGRRKIEKEN